MRLCPTLFKGFGRRGQPPETVPIKQMIPLKLQNRVVGSGKQSLEDKCLFEMSLLFRCWQENQFSDKMCSQYVDKLQNCHQNLVQKTVLHKEQQKVDIPTPNAKNLGAKQLSYLLRKYPTV